MLPVVLELAALVPRIKKVSSSLFLLLFVQYLLLILLTLLLDCHAGKERDNVKTALGTNGED